VILLDYSIVNVIFVNPSWNQNGNTGTFLLVLFGADSELTSFCTTFP
jgi:hypothetical protein